MNKQLTRFTALLALSFFASFSTHAQTIIGIKAGMNLSNVNLVNENSEKQHTESIPGFQMGLSITIPLISDFHLQPAIQYAGKGFKQDGGWLANSGNEFKAKVSYIELPVNFLYKPHIGIGNLLLGAGPYVGYGTGGKWESDGLIVVGDIMLSANVGDVIFRHDVMDGEFGNYMYGKPWDYGANVLIGYEFLQRVSLQLNAQFGIANLQPEVGNEARDGSIRNRAYGISLAYGF